MEGYGKEEEEEEEEGYKLQRITRERDSNSPGGPDKAACVATLRQEEEGGATGQVVEGEEGEAKDEVVEGEGRGATGEAVEGEEGGATGEVVEDEEGGATDGVVEGEEAAVARLLLLLPVVSIIALKRVTSSDRVPTMPLSSVY